MGEDRVAYKKTETSDRSKGEGQGGAREIELTQVTDHHG